MLTEKIVRDARSHGKARTIWDKHVTGLGLQITPAGRKNFVLRYPVDGKWRQRILCREAQFSLAEIRRLAAEVLLRVRGGEVDPLGRGRELRDAPTVAQGLDRFFGEYVPARIAIRRMSERTVYDYRQQSRQCVRPSLGRFKVADVTRCDVEQMVSALSPVRRNRILAFASRLFGAFEEWECRPWGVCRMELRPSSEP